MFAFRKRGFSPSYLCSIIVNALINLIHNKIRSHVQQTVLKLWLKS
jgi:hypothetical protein